MKIKSKNNRKSKKINNNKDNDKNDEIELINSEINKFDWSKFNCFEDLPISKATKNGLSKNNYITPTDIQRQTIGYALNGNDVLGAAKTGSGKTLAFLIPLLECLYRNRWTSFDGVGALIISPTRELSYQIFEVLKKIGIEHDFSAGLIIGGKDLEFESKRMDRCNIVVCTPGRLLQHMDENPLFNCDNLKMLILDEADRILDLGFAKTMNAIIQNLPKQRQTLLFSATQTKLVKDLVKLSLKNPIYISSHEHEKHATPDNLQQSYIVCPVEDKINMLWSFIRQHTKHKIIVFMSTCKQVKFVYELFCQLRPGISLIALYGTLHQLKRMAIYDRFCESTKIVLFATDIAARGLDFPAVNWVVQLDCPEDTRLYIHRVGRTARFERNGESLLVLTPNEEQSMIEQLKQKKIPIEKIQVNPQKLNSIQRKSEALLAKHLSLKESAQRAFKAYLKSIFMMKDKTIFQYQYIDVEKFAQSLGLLSAPRVRFIERKLSKNNSVNNDNFNDNNKIVSIQNDDNNDDDDDFNDLYQVKKYEFKNNEKLDLSQFSRQRKKQLTKAAVSKRLLKKNIVLNSKFKFDDDCNIIDNSNDNGGVPKKQTSELTKKLNEIDSGIDIELAKQIMKDEDVIDKKLYRNLIKEKHQAKKLKMKELKREKMKSNNGDEDDGDDDMDDDYDEESDYDDSTTRQYIDELPDPNKVFGDNNNDNDDDDDIDNDNDDDDNQESDLQQQEQITSKKRNKRFISKPNNNKRQKSDSIDNLEYYEQMAQKLLNVH